MRFTRWVGPALALVASLVLTPPARAGTTILNAVNANGPSGWYAISNSSRCRMQFDLAAGTANMAVEQSEKVSVLPLPLVSPKNTWTTAISDILNVAITGFVRANVSGCVGCTVSAVLTCERWTPSGLVDSSPTGTVSQLDPARSPTSRALDASPPLAQATIERTRTEQARTERLPASRDLDPCPAQDEPLDLGLLPFAVGGAVTRTARLAQAP
jgi:hypothetical protein